MDRCIVGHEETKKGILLALVAREHVYIEGPPGTAKTMLAEVPHPVVSEAVSLDFFFYQLHRDTRLAELIGDMVVVREEDAQSGGEIIRTVNRPGGILTSQICVLDDVSRAPGEALNVLLRILNERKFEKRKLPLMTAIATGNPPGEAYYSEPLDPANLDRFTVQIKSGGLVSQGAWAGVADVIARYESQGEVGLDAIDVAGAVSPGLIAACNESLPQVTLPEEVVDGLLSLLQSLVNCYDLDPGNAILSDRTFLVKAAHAILEGRDCCEVSDLRVMPYLTTFRVPAEVHAEVPLLVEEVIKTANRKTKKSGSNKAQVALGGSAAKGAVRGSGDSAAGPLSWRPGTAKPRHANDGFKAKGPIANYGVDDQPAPYTKPTGPHYDAVYTRERVESQYVKKSASMPPHPKAGPGDRRR